MPTDSQSAREITQRKLVLVFNYCFHGTVDESFISLKNGIPGLRRGNLGPPVDPVITTRVIEFNDLGALERTLANRDVACVLMEPVMTNAGIVHPEPGYHDSLRVLTRKYGTLLIIDETHTICAGPGGYTGEQKLDPTSSCWGNQSPAACRLQPTDSLRRLLAACLSGPKRMSPTPAGSEGHWLGTHFLSP